MPIKSENTTLKKDQVNEQESEHLGTELGEKLRQHKNLEEVVTKQQKKG